MFLSLLQIDVDVTGPLTVCTTCLTEYGRGRNHVCDRASRLENLQTLIRQTSDRSKEILVSSQLKQIANEKGQQRQEFKIGTEGTPLRVKLGKEKVVRPKPFFDHDKMMRLKAKLGLSDRNTKEVAHFLRIELGKKSVEKGLELKMRETNHKLDHLFKVEMIKYKQSKPSENNKKERIVTSVEKPTVYCTDIEELIAKTVRERDLNPDNIEIQVGMD